MKVINCRCDECDAKFQLSFDESVFKDPQNICPFCKSLDTINSGVMVNGSTNFERLKSLNSEYEMADLIMYVVSKHYGEIIKGDGTLNGLPVLKWLQEEHENVKE